MRDFTKRKEMPEKRDGYERFFDAGSGLVYYRLRRGPTTMGASFDVQCLINPILRAGVAHRIRAIRKVIL